MTSDRVVRRIGAKCARTAASMAMNDESVMPRMIAHKRRSSPVDRNCTQLVEDAELASKSWIPIVESRAGTEIL